MAAKKSSFTLLVFIILLYIFPNIGGASFYQAGTMAKYCEHYLSFIALAESADQHEAGICAGYLASALEIMDLSGQLCNKDQINLNNVASLYIDEVNTSNLDKQPASFVMIELFQKNYSCEEK